MVIVTAAQDSGNVPAPQIDSLQPHTHARVQEARAQGVRRNMRGDEACALCPDLILVQVPTAHGKADLTLYRAAGRRVLALLAACAGACERASIDEAYLDLTEAAAARLAKLGPPPFAPPPGAERVHVGAEAPAAPWHARARSLWQPGEALLAAGAAVVAELRADVRTQTGYTCSAGLAHTKLLAKLASGLHKPDACTLVAAAGVPELLADLPLARLRMLGGKYGAGLTDALGVTTAGQLAALPRSRLEAVAGEKDAAWLAGLCRGVDGEEVVERRLPKSQSCGKTFRGRRSALADLNAVRHWLGELGGLRREEGQGGAGECGELASRRPVWRADAGL